LVIGRSKFLADNSQGPAGDGFYEFQKEHQTVQELKKQVAELTMDLQKVNAQLELSKSVSHVAENN
jgi:chaperonin cofactor prefoldin